MEQTLGSLARLDREVGSRRVAHEERVAGQHDPRIRAAREIDDRDATVLGPVSRRVDATKDDVAEHDLGSVFHGVVRILGIRGRMDAYGGLVLERQAPVAGEVVGVGVRLDHANDAHPLPLGIFEVLLDREGRIDHDRLPSSGIADEVGSTPQRVVDELREDHGRARP